MGQWIVGVTSFQKIFGLCGLKCHIMEIWTDVTLDDTRTTECEDSARILETEFAKRENGENGDNGENGEMDKMEKGGK